MVPFARGGGYLPWVMMLVEGDYISSTRVSSQDWRPQR
jgi:hypothetical protein